ncbi:glycoside hydrolase family 43 protein [Gaoshiqia sp. Z1-71]|uniref:glycoside hydrolase family 43 protein n=1 Tax=Gaoshiqia hydrogeniformans TaxID=3290090 RepID=UPI003BF7F474
MESTSRYLVTYLLIAGFSISCNSKKPVQQDVANALDKTYSNPLLHSGARPWATWYKDHYYYFQDADDRITMWKTPDITDLKNAPKKEVWIPRDEKNASHLWAPEMYRIDNKWYIYFAADDGNTDNHQIYVVENSSDDPFEGEFTMKGRIKTDNDNSWGIHASVFQHQSEWYMIWSGWQTRRVEAETQCIYIARLENPWTLASERILISKPEYEWERQWINPDGSKTGYPIYVNEDPQCFYTRDKSKVLIYYSASGTWTPYYTVGMLYADANANLLNPASWQKSNKPVFKQNPDNQVFSTGSPCFIPSPDGTETYFLYQARATEKEPYGSLPSRDTDTRSPRLQKMTWDDQGFPVFGEALSEIEKIDKPSGL